MKVIDVVQGSSEWHALRSRSVGASDVSAITGTNPWKSKLQLWTEKMGLDQQHQTEAMQRGKDLEPLVLAEFPGFQPLVVSHDAYEWAIASLDGWNGDTQIVLEIKCPSKAVYDMALVGKIPPYYMEQIQWQLFVTGARSAIYAVHRDGNTRSMDIPCNTEMQRRIFMEAKKFYEEHIVKMLPPDDVECEQIANNDPEALIAADIWKEAKAALVSAEDTEKRARNALIEHTDDGDTLIGDVSLTRLAREGSVDWKKLWADVCAEHPELAQKYNPAQYRSPGIGYWRLSIKT